MSDCVLDAPESMASYAEARRQAILSFERTYVLALLTRSGGNVSHAARLAKIDRVYLHRLMRRHRATRATEPYESSDSSPCAASLCDPLRPSHSP